MSNAASRLVTIFERWRNEASPQKRYSALRNLDGDGFDETLVAMGCIAEIDQQLAEMRERGEPVEHFGDAFRVWVETVIGRNVGWNNPTQAKGIINTSHLSELRSLSMLIDMGNRHSAVEPFVKSLLERVSEVRQALDEDEDLDPWLRARIIELLDTAEQILRDRPSPAEVRRIWDDISVTLLAAQADAGDGRRQRWVNVRERWMYPGAVGVLSNLVTQGIISGGTAVAGALTQ